VLTACYAAYITEEVEANAKAIRGRVDGEEQRTRCRKMVRAGSAPARSIMHAQVLLKADASSEGPGWTDSAISDAFGVTTVTLARIRKVMVTEGLEAALAH